MMTLCKALIFLFSFFGLTAFVANYIRTKTEFIPLLTISLISLIILFAGFFNVMLVVSFFMYIFGIIYAIYLIVKKKLSKPSLHIKIIVVVVGILLLYLFIGQLMHYDNFSHWALIVKDMLRLNSYPTQINDSVVAFITYPPGSANFIYYVCRFISTNQQAMIFAQSLITFFSVIPLLALIKKQQVFSYIAFFVALCIAFTINIQIHDLLVDSILATIGASLTIIITCHRHDLKKGLFVIVPVMIFLCLIKNSGIFFVVGNLVLYFYFYLKNEKLKLKDIVVRGFFLSLPFIMMVLWSRHVSLSYTSELISGAKHTMSLSAYLRNLELLDWTAIAAISKQYLNAIFSFQYRNITLFYTIDLIAIVVSIFFVKKYRKSIAALNLILVVYLISLWAMYLFSMPYNEAIDLASFDRYFLTFFLYYLLILFMLFYISEASNIMSITVTVTSILTLSFVCDVSTLVYPSYNKIKLVDSGRQQVTRSLNAYLLDESVSDGKSLVVNVEDQSYSKDYYSYYIQYLLHQTEITIIGDLAQFTQGDEVYLIDTTK